jgi:hypothetical protein
MTRTEYKREWCRRNPDKVAVLNERRREQQRKFRATAEGKAYDRERRTGFTQADWDARFVSQGGMCAICREDAAHAADHNHQTGQKRGLLCRGCNTSLGRIENPLYPKLLAYLSEWNARG